MHASKQDGEPLDHGVDAPASVSAAAAAAAADNIRMVGEAWAGPIQASPVQPQDPA